MINSHCYKNTYSKQCYTSPSLCDETTGHCHVQSLSWNWQIITPSWNIHYYNKSPKNGSNSRWSNQHKLKSHGLGSNPEVVYEWMNVVDIFYYSVIKNHAVQKPSDTLYKFIITALPHWAAMRMWGPNHTQSPFLSRAQVRHNK